jgi:hypothetical protein
MLRAMSKRWVILVAALGCGGKTQTQPITPVQPEFTVKITKAGIGPLNAKTPANLIGLRQALVGYDVKPINKEGLEFEVRQNGELLYTVVPDEEGMILNVHVSNAKFGVENHTWGIGKQLAPGDAPSCECWGEHPVCYKKGDNVAAAFDQSCDYDDYDEDRLRKKLTNVNIARVVWSPHGFDYDGYGGDEYGGYGNPCGGDWEGNPCGGD